MNQTTSETDYFFLSMFFSMSHNEWEGLLFMTSVEILQ